MCFSLLSFSECSVISKTAGGAIDGKKFPYINWDVPHKKQNVIVNGVYDGDTIVVEGMEKAGEEGTVVRLLGVDTPEVAHPDMGFDTDEPGALEATEFTKSTVNWKKVLLVFNPENAEGIFGRTLALIFYKDESGAERCLNWELLRRGHAEADIWAKDSLCNRKRWEQMARMARLKTSRAYLEMGRQCLLEKFVYDALDYYNRGVEKYPSAVPIRKDLAALYYNLSKYESDEDKKSSYSESALFHFRKLLDTKYDALARQRIKALQ
ncbi:MAG: thermonuclease family protein [bacterium]